MTAPAITVPGAVSRRWKTGLVIGNVDLSGIITADPSDGLPSDGQRCQTIPPGSPASQALTGQFLDSMNALAEADERSPRRRAPTSMSRSGATDTICLHSPPRPATPPGLPGGQPRPGTF